MPRRVALVGALSVVVVRAGAAVADPRACRVGGGAACAGGEDEASLMQMRGHRDERKAVEQIVGQKGPRTSGECKTKEHYCHATCEALDESPGKCIEHCMEKGAFFRSKCTMDEYCHHDVCDDEVGNGAKVSKDVPKPTCRTKDHYCAAFCRKYPGVWDDCHDRCTDRFSSLEAVWTEYCTHDVCPCTPKPKPPQEKKTALLVLDVQDCFLDKDTTSGAPGSLPVEGASQIIPKINKIRTKKNCLYDVVVSTKDFHPINHISFASTHGLEPFSHLGGKGGLPIMCINPSSAAPAAEASCCPKQHIDPSLVDCATHLCPPAGWTWTEKNPEFIKHENNPACKQCKDDPTSCFETTQEMWTDHCLQDGDSTFPPGLKRKPTDIVTTKGENTFVDAYSAFYDNSKHFKTQLDAILQENGVDEVHVVGIATDVVVRHTVEDALSDLTSPYTVKVIADATAGLSEDTTKQALDAMAASGAEIISVSDVLDMKCHSN